MPRETKKVRLSPPPTGVVNPAVANQWLRTVFDRTGDGPLLIQGYARANVPDAQVWGSITTDNLFSSIIFVIDAGGATPMLAFSNGTDWRRVDNGAAI
jgi:hypothetical protein